MITAIIAAAMLFQASPDVPLDDPNGMETCVVTKTVELGTGNTESGEALVRASWASCQRYVPHLERQSSGNALMARYDRGRRSDGYESDAKVLFDERKEEITGKAILALLEARAS